MDFFSSIYVSRKASVREGLQKKECGNSPDANRCGWVHFALFPWHSPIRLRDGGNYTPHDNWDLTISISGIALFTVRPCVSPFPL